MTTTKEDTKNPNPFVLIAPCEVELVDDQNVRSDLPEIEELAADIKERGLLEPPVVRNGGSDPKKPYKLVIGRRRFAALEALGLSKKPIYMKVIAKEKPLDRLAMNFAENAKRTNVSFFDQSELIEKLVKGTYAVDEDEKAVPVSKDDICQRLQISSNTFSRLRKIYANVIGDVAKKAAHVKAPYGLLTSVALVAGDGETPEEKLEDRQKKQIKMLDSWVNHKKQLEAQGRTRGERSDRGSKKGKKGKKAAEEPRALVNPNKTVTPAQINKEGEKVAPRRSMADYQSLIAVKLEGEKDKLVAARLSGMLDTFRFLHNEIKKLPGITKADWKLLDPNDDGDEADE